MATVKIKISWLLKKSTDLDLHCFQRQGIFGFSRIRVNVQGIHKPLLMYYGNIIIWHSALRFVYGLRFSNPTQCRILWEPITTTLSTRYRTSGQVTVLTIYIYFENLWSQKCHCHLQSTSLSSLCSIQGTSTNDNILGVHMIVNFHRSECCLNMIFDLQIESVNHLTMFSKCLGTLFGTGTQNGFHYHIKRKHANKFISVTTNFLIMHLEHPWHNSSQSLFKFFGVGS